jgi:hypothetical protein
MQKEQELPHEINGSILPYKSPRNATLDTGGVVPFIPLSPYLIQMYSPTGNQLAPLEPGGSLTDDYYMVDQNNNPQETQL